jgi:hypothetical protein
MTTCAAPSIAARIVRAMEKSAFHSTRERVSQYRVYRGHELRWLAQQVQRFAHDYPLSRRGAQETPLAIVAAAGMWIMQAFGAVG